jgi:exonuclease VII large subunit
LNPENILKRGYSIAIKKEKKEIIRDVDQIEAGEELYLLLYKGRLLCSVEEKLNQ